MPSWPRSRPRTSARTPSPMHPRRVASMASMVAILAVRAAGVRERNLTRQFTRNHGRTPVRKVLSHASRGGRLGQCPSCSGRSSVCRVLRIAKVIGDRSLRHAARTSVAARRRLRVSSPTSGTMNGSTVSTRTTTATSSTSGGRADGRGLRVTSCIWHAAGSASAALPGSVIRDLVTDPG